MPAELSQFNVWVTRPAPQASATASLFEKMGLHCWTYPVIERISLKSPDAQNALRSSIQPDWLILTSSHGVLELNQRCQKQNLSISQRFASTRVASVGPKTSASLIQLGLSIDLEPPEFNADALAACFQTLPVQAQVAWLFRARQGDPRLPQQLRAAGLELKEFHLYDTQPLHPSRGPEILQTLKTRNIHAITFLSPSAVHALAQLCGTAIRDSQYCLASLGPATSRALKNCFGRVDLEAPEASVTALGQSLLRYSEGSIAS